MSAYRKMMLLFKGLLYDSKSGYASASKQFAEDDLDVDAKGRVFLVTGANSGIGFCVCKYIAARGGEVHMVCRNRERGSAAKNTIVRETENEKVFLHVLDMSNIAQVVQFAATFTQQQKALDVLVNNAGEMITDCRTTEPEGLNVAFVTNSLGPYALTEGLLSLIRKSRNNPRVVFVSSAGMLLQKLDHQFFNNIKDSYDPTMSYAQCKRQQAVLAEYWASKYPDVHFSAMHPGWVDTAAARRGLGEFYDKMKAKFRTPEEGADTVIWLCLSNAALARASGQFFQDRKVVSKHIPLAFTEESKSERSQFIQFMEDSAKVSIQKIQG